MEGLSQKYILLQDRVGLTVERNILSLGLSTRQSPTQVLRGELLEALPESEQPQDSTKIALAGIDRKSLRLECGMEFIYRLSAEDTSLLLAISSLEERYQTHMDRIRLDFGRNILPGSKVYVTVKGIAKKLPGVVWYKGELPTNSGTMFGVELIVSMTALYYLLFIKLIIYPGIFMYSMKKIIIITWYSCLRETLVKMSCFLFVQNLLSLVRCH